MLSLTNLDTPQWSVNTKSQISYLTEYKEVLRKS